MVPVNRTEIRNPINLWQTTGAKGIINRFTRVVNFLDYDDRIQKWCQNELQYIFFLTFLPKVEFITVFLIIFPALCHYVANVAEEIKQ